MRLGLCAGLVAMVPFTATAQAICTHQGISYGHGAQICVSGSLWLCTSGGYWSTVGSCRADEADRPDAARAAGTGPQLPDALRAVSLAVEADR